MPTAARSTSPDYCNVRASLARYYAMVNHPLARLLPRVAWQALAERLTCASPGIGRHVMVNSAVLDCECRAVDC